MPYDVWTSKGYDTRQQTITRPWVKRERFFYKAKNYFHCRKRYQVNKKYADGTLVGSSRHYSKKRTSSNKCFALFSFKYMT